MSERVPLILNTPDFFRTCREYLLLCLPNPIAFAKQHAGGYEK